METCIAFKDWLFVTVPEDGNGFTMYENYISFYEGQRSFQTMRDIQLPSGSYQIIGKGDALDNSQWSEIVDSKKERGGAFNPEVGHYQSTGWTTFYKNYEHPEPSVCIPNTATESGHSLLRSLDMEPETTLVLKKNDV